VIKRNQAVIDAEEWERRYWDLREGAESGGNVDELKNELLLVNRKNELLQKKLSSMGDEVELLKENLLRASQSSKVLNNSDDYSSEDEGSAAAAAAAATTTTTTTPSKPKSIANALSPAPPAVLSELNRTRIKLADSERQNRQLARKVESLTAQANEMIQYREASQGALEKITNLENALKVVRREREALRIVEARWVEFRKDLVKHNLGSEVLQGGGGGGGADENIPPEIATLVRHFRQLEDKVKEVESNASVAKVKFDVAQRRVQVLEKENKDKGVETKKWGEDKVAMKDKLIKAEMELRTIQAQERVWKREADSLRSLLDTYKQMEDNMARSGKDAKADSKASSQNDATVTGLQLSLLSAKDEIKILKEQFDTTKSERDSTENEITLLKEEHENVRAKFVKLRDALFQEREKAEKAEDRAVQAETLAGKGAFNLETTRVLHFQNNPLSNAIREKYHTEIEALKSELAELTAAQKGLKGTPQSLSKLSNNPEQTLDAQKFNKRLKESFREQIALFREGVHLITGYKIDMIADSDTPRFKVRSMFAEREGDHLEFLWRKDKDGKPRTSMDILDTELAQVLSKEAAFDYMRKFNSLPAFMASVCLTLFEKQTMA